MLSGHSVGSYGSLTVLVYVAMLHSTSSCYISVGRLGLGQARLGDSAETPRLVSVLRSSAIP